MSKSQVSEPTKELDPLVESFRNRPLDDGLCTFVWLDAIARRCRGSGRVVSVISVIATGVNAPAIARSSTSTCSPARTRRDGRRFFVDWPPRIERREAGHIAGLRATLSNPLHAKPAEQGAQESPGVGGYAGPVDLRSTDEQRSVGTARAGL